MISNTKIFFLLLLLCELSLQVHLFPEKRIEKPIEPVKLANDPLTHKNELSTQLSKMENESKMERNCASTLSFWLTGIQMIAYVDETLFEINSNSECEYNCYISIFRSDGWTRNATANICYCFSEPFGNGGDLSMTTNSAWTTGFFRNENWTRCGNYYIAAQQLSFYPYYKPGNTGSGYLCGISCYGFGYSTWSWDTSGTCYCGSQNFNSNAMVYESSHQCGFNFF